jgi:hypothetical protein
VAYYNVSAPTTRALIQISTASITTTSSGYIVKAVQDVTVNASNGTFQWTQLDNQSQLTVATPSSNSISANITVDDSQFFTATTGIFDLSNNKTLVYFRVYFNGYLTGSKYIAGTGYVTSLAPTVNPTAPVWVTPIGITVDGEFTAGTV